MRNIHVNNHTIKRHLDMLSTAFGVDIVNFLNDPGVIEIMLNPDGKLWIESYDAGKYFTGILFDENQAANIIKLIAAYNNEIADYEHPEVACELPQTSSRFQGWLPPVVTAPAFAIRKRATHIFTFDNYIDNGSLTIEQAQHLRQAICNRKNILVAGGTSSGKTTFVNAILHELRDSKDRVVILEDLPELQVSIADCVKFMTTSRVSMRALVKGVLRMRPDRIIIGEVRDGTALDLLKAWNTGHPGGVCTVHANSPEATILRLEDLVREATAIVPVNLISEAIDLIVFMRRNNEGRYQVDSITETT